MSVIAAMIAVAAFSSEQDTSGIMVKKGGRIFIDGQKLSESQVLSSFSGLNLEDGTRYDVLWAKVAKRRSVGVGLTIAGSSTLAVGAGAFAVGFVYLIVTAVATPFYAIANAYGAQETVAEGLDGNVRTASAFLLGGTIGCVSGIGMLGAGIPILCVNNSRMKKYVNAYNGSLLPAPQKVTLNFGAQRNGIGLALNF